MLYTDSSLIKSRMNALGNQRTPFLFAVNFELTEGFIIEDPESEKDIFFQINARGNKYLLQQHEKSTSVRLDLKPIAKESYKKSFDIVHKGLLRGDSFLTNLTVRTPIGSNLTLQDIFIRNNAPYQLYYPEEFVCFSPERFVLIRDGKISTNPMKGTIDASIPDAQQIILNDFKEKAEHNTIVDLLRNDLSCVATNVHVNRFRYIDRIETNTKDILQVSSEITGTLPSDYYKRLGDIIFSMLPAGSVSGAPKQATLNIIKEAEQCPRGYYTGIFGYFDGTELDSGVLIRFIEQTGDGEFYFRSGGGITAYSNWEDEYNEVQDKIYLPFR